MSDILIKGMEMLSIGTYEASIDVTKSNGKTAISVYLRGENDSRRFGVRVYEAVHVPPHGRLIDADALDIYHRAEQAIEEYLGDDIDNFYLEGNRDGLCEAAKQISIAPTVIPASEVET